jgi:uncharacterized protein YneF (UPF0154 family)
MKKSAMLIVVVLAFTLALIIGILIGQYSEQSNKLKKNQCIG